MQQGTLKQVPVHASSCDLLWGGGSPCPSGRSEHAEKARLNAGVGEAALRELLGAFHEQDHLQRGPERFAIERPISRGLGFACVSLRAGSQMVHVRMLSVPRRQMLYSSSISTRLVFPDKVINRRLQLRRQTHCCVQLACERTSGSRCSLERLSRGWSVAVRHHKQYQHPRAGHGYLPAGVVGERCGTLIRIISVMLYSYGVEMGGSEGPQPPAPDSSAWTSRAALRRTHPALPHPRGTCRCKHRRCSN